MGCDFGGWMSNPRFQNTTVVANMGVLHKFMQNLDAVIMHISMKHKRSQEYFDDSI